MEPRVRVEGWVAICQGIVGGGLLSPALLVGRRSQRPKIDYIRYRYIMAA
jgi:hypothetical protein